MGRDRQWVVYRHNRPIDYVYADERTDSFRLADELIGQGYPADITVRRRRR